MSEAKHGEASAVSWMEMKYRHDAPHLNQDSLMNPVSVLHSLMNQVLALQLPPITQKCLRFRPRKLTRFVEKRRHRDLKSALASLPRPIRLMCLRCVKNGSGGGRKFVYLEWAACNTANHRTRKTVNERVQTMDSDPPPSSKCSPINYAVLLCLSTKRCPLSLSRRRDRCLMITVA